jgi:hypothetical protein
MGSGGGHLAPLLRLAAALKRRGMAVDFASTRLAWRSPGWSAVDRVFQAPVPGPSLPGWTYDVGGEARNYFDELRMSGFEVSAMLSKHFRAWQDLIKAADPDFVIADFSPGAVFACRGLVPAASTGVPYCTPPVVDGRIPDLSVDEPSNQSTPATLLAVANQVRAAAGLATLGTAAEAFVSDIRFPFGLTEIDPYAAVRPEALLPPTVENCATEPGGGDEIQVFLPARYKNDPVVLATLIGLKRPVRIDDRDLDEEARHFYLQAGVRIDGTLIDTATMAERAALVIHHGGFGTVCRCLLAGVPQFALVSDREKRANCTIIGDEKLGEAMTSSKRTVTVLTDAINRILDDRSFAERARALAPDFRRRRAAGETSEMIADAVADRLG